MKYNIEGLKKLIKRLRMEPEFERLREAGLTNNGIAEVFNSLFNPDSETIFGEFARTVYGRIKKEKGKLPSFPEIERWKIFCASYGINTVERPMTMGKAIKTYSAAGNTDYKRNLLSHRLNKAIGDEPVIKTGMYADLRKGTPGKLKLEVYRRALENILTD